MPLGLKIFLVAVIISVVVAVSYGIFLVGSPNQQRLIQFDERRVSHLQSISYAIDGFYGKIGKLPVALEDLRVHEYYIESFQDLGTGKPYEYVAVSETVYELCADFQTDSSQYKDGRQLPRAVPVFDGRGQWDHGIGRACFKREMKKPQPAEGPLPYSVPVE